MEAKIVYLFFNAVLVSWLITLGHLSILYNIVYTRTSVVSFSSVGIHKYITIWLWYGFEFESNSQIYTHYILSMYMSTYASSRNIIDVFRFVAVVKLL